MEENDNLDQLLGGVNIEIFRIFYPAGPRGVTPGGRIPLLEGAATER